MTTTQPIEALPENNLPSYEECELRVHNSRHFEKQLAEGGHGPEADSKLATQLHRFIHEYDDADPVRSAWFLHRLELLLEETKAQAVSAALAARPSPTVEREPWHVYLADRADGVRGHFAIARLHPRGYREVWNLRSHEWNAFSDDVLTREQADALLATMSFASPPPQEADRIDAERDVLAERRRQIQAEGWTPEHDDEHESNEIAAAAAFYAMPPSVRDWPAGETGYGATFGEAITPEFWRTKTGDRRGELVKAGALVLAEIERLDRAAARAAKEQQHDQ